MNIFRPFRYWDRVEIEAQAIEILLQMQRTPNYVPNFPLDASRVAEFLGLDLVWDSFPEDGDEQIAARILPLQRLIEINENIPQLRWGLGESTIAHEIGHWVLHIDHQKLDDCIEQQQQGKFIEVEPLLCRSSAVAIEWQAQYFAGCLLMPQYQLVKLQHGRDLTRWAELYAIANDLGVTISNLVHRLRDLGWIDLAHNSRRIYLGTAAPMSGSRGKAYLAPTTL